MMTRYDCNHPPSKTTIKIAFSACRGKIDLMFTRSISVHSQHSHYTFRMSIFPLEDELSMVAFFIKFLSLVSPSKLNMGLLIRYKLVFVHSFSLAFQVTRLLITASICYVIVSRSSSLLYQGCLRHRITVVIVSRLSSSSYHGRHRHRITAVSVIVSRPSSSPYHGRQRHRITAVIVIVSQSSSYHGRHRITAVIVIVSRPSSSSYHGL